MPQKTALLEGDKKWQGATCYVIVRMQQINFEQNSHEANNVVNTKISLGLTEVKMPRVQ